MKRLLLAATAVLLSISASAAGVVDTDALKAYAAKSLAKCPSATITLDRVEGQGPIGFVIFRVTMTSTDESCGRQTYLLYSPTSQQTLMGTIFPLEDGPRPLEQRLSSRASELLKTPISASVSSFPLPDRLKAVSMVKQSEWGPFSYHGFVDSSERFLIVGTRGNLRVDPGKTLVESLGAGGAKRGNSMAKIEIIELSDFQCPTCGRAHKRIEPIIARNLSKIRYTRIDLPLFEHHEWAMPAALGGRAIHKVAPAKYWTYVDFIFSMQDAITRPTFDKVLQDFCSDHDIDWKAVEKVYKSPAERTALLDQISRAFDNSIISTPTYIINGQAIGYGPEGSFTIDTIKKTLGVK